VEGRMLEELSPDQRDELRANLKTCVRNLGGGF
jgi:hypothetical protein